MVQSMNLERLAAEFDVPGEVLAVRPVESGNINKTYRVTKKSPQGTTEFFLQRINSRVFPQPGLVVSNTLAVARHIQERLASSGPAEPVRRQVSTVIPTVNRAECHIDGQGEFWRAMTAITGATAYEKVLNPEHACEVGGVLGWFHSMIADFPVSQLIDTLPGFHITPAYLQQYDEVLQSVDGARRLEITPGAGDLAGFVDQRRPFAGVLQEALARGELKLRPIHGDPKINNIMIDNESGRGVAIIDTDTVKPGLIHYDFGDCVRSACNPAGEEARDPSEVGFDLAAFECLCSGYLENAGDFMTGADRHYLYDSIRLIAFELGLRFFTDFLGGDVYFNTRYPGQNLNRAGVQFRLCSLIEEHEGTIRRIIAEAS